MQAVKLAVKVKIKAECRKHFLQLRPMPIRLALRHLEINPRRTFLDKIRQFKKIIPSRAPQLRLKVYVAKWPPLRQKLPSQQILRLRSRSSSLSWKPPRTPIWSSNSALNSKRSKCKQPWNMQSESTRDKLTISKISWRTCRRAMPRRLKNSVWKRIN